MSAYQFHYLNRKKALSCLVVMACASDENAKERALSLPNIYREALQIWRGETLVFDSKMAIN